MPQAIYVQAGETIDYTPAANVAAGQVVELGGRVGIAKSPIAAQTLGVLATMGIFDVAKASEEISAGVEVYWDRDATPVGGAVGSGAATTVAEGNTYMGTAIRGAQATDATVRLGLLSLAGNGAGSSQSGPTGPVGATGPVGLMWRGAWSNSVSYQRNDAVRWSGSSYICLQSNTGRDPQNNPSYWDLLAARGDTGSTGAQGANGPAGPQGVAGLIGPQGNTGPTGLQGEYGPTGPQGETGPSGPQGDSGPAGPQGETGATGATGSS